MPSPGLRVRVVNDDPDILALIAEVLADEGYRVTTRLAAFGSPAAVAALAPDLLVADLRLGGSLADGLAFLGRLRADPRTAALPVLVCSAAHPEALGEAAARLGERARALVSKPFDLEELLAAVAGCLGRA